LVVRGAVGLVAVGRGAGGRVVGAAVGLSGDAPTLGSAEGSADELVVAVGMAGLE
jgi:hypothetical protein